MKRFLTVCITLLIGTMLFAQTDDIRYGKTYYLKSTDGSGQIPLYRHGASIPALQLPEGTEITAGRSYSAEIEVKYDNYSYLIRKENFGEETSASKEAEAAAKKSTDMARNVRGNRHVFLVSKPVWVYINCWRT